MSSSDLREKLISALGRGTGLLDMFRGSPVDAAARIVGDRFAEGLPIVEDLVRRGPSSTVRAHAVQLWPKLLLARPMPSPKEMAQMKEPYTVTGPFDAAVEELGRDADPGVRAAVAATVFRYGGPSTHKKWRKVLAHVRPDLEAHRELEGADDALRQLEGSAGVVQRIEAAAAASSPPSPDDLLTDLTELQREPTPVALPALAKLFPKLRVVVDQGIPKRHSIPGIAVIYDPESTLAFGTIRAWIACAGPEKSADAIDFIDAAGPELLAVIIGMLADCHEGGATLAVAIAATETFPAKAREQAIFALSAIAAQTEPLPREVARAGLADLSNDPAIGRSAAAALRVLERS